MCPQNNNEAQIGKGMIVIFELIKRRFDNEGERTNSLDGKAGNFVGFVSVVVGLLLGGGRLCREVIYLVFPQFCPTIYWLYFIS